MTTTKQDGASAKGRIGPWRQAAGCRFLDRRGRGGSWQRSAGAGRPPIEGGMVDFPATGLKTAVAIGLQADMRAGRY